MEILDRFGLGDQPQIPSILHRAPVVQVAFQPDVPIPSEVRVEHVRELVKRDPASVPAVEELYLQPSEETLGARCPGCSPSSTSTSRCRDLRISLSTRASDSGSLGRRAPWGARPP